MQNGCVTKTGLVSALHLEITASSRPAKQALQEQAAGSNRLYRTVFTVKNLSMIMAGAALLPWRERLKYASIHCSCLLQTLQSVKNTAEFERILTRL